MYGRTAIVASISSAISFALILVHEGVRYYTGKPIRAIDWVANALIVMTALYIRKKVDEEKYRQTVMESLPEGRPVNPMRFINGMPAAMVAGLAADITIPCNFIAGMLLYLAMQGLLIYSFSGVLPISFRDYNSGESSGYYRVITILWVLVPIVVFFSIIYNGLQSLVVLPYLCFLSIMTIMTYLAFSVKARPLLFRLLPVVASTVFFVSDLFVGYVAFNDPPSKYYLTISVTYIIAVLSFNVTILFLKNGRGEYVVS